MPIRVISNRTGPAAAAAAPASPPLPAFAFPAPPPGITQKPEGVSLCMIVKNEERFLAQCLNSVADAVDEICVVDTGSTDRTVEIATSFGARVEHHEWRNDFAWARNKAVEMATRRWVIMLDADEELLPQCKTALKELRTIPAGHVGGWVRCYNQADDYAGTGAMSHVLVRVFPNDERVRFRGKIHEFVTLDNANHGIAAVQTPIAIVHHGYLKDVVNERGKAARNLEIVRAAIDEDPNDAFNWFNLGSTAFMMDEFETARDAFEKMRELNGTERRGFVPNGLAILAEIYCDKLKDPIKGEEIALVSLRFSPHYANAHFQLGKALVAQGRFDEARAAYKEAIADKDFAQQQFVVDDQVYLWKAHSEIGSSYVMQNDDASAITWYRAGMKNAPSIEPLMLNLARALERTGEQQEAYGLFRKACETFRDEWSTIDLVNYLLRQKSGELALSVIDENVAGLRAQAAVSLLTAAAQIAAQLGRADDTARYLELAAERDPGNAEVLNELEQIYRRNGDIEGLARLLERERESTPVSIADYVRRANQATARNDFSSALSLAQAGLKIASDDPNLQYIAGYAASTLGDTEDALALLEKISDPKATVFVAALMLRASILRAKGNNDDATAVIEAVLAHDPKNIDALLQKASLCELRSDLANAEASLREVTMLSTQRGAVELSTFLMRHGRFEEAARIADAALQ